MLEKPFNKSPSAKAALPQTTPNSPGLRAVFSHSPFSINITTHDHTLKELGITIASVVFKVMYGDHVILIKLRPYFVYKC